MPGKTVVIPPPLSNTVFPILVHQCENDPEREQSIRGFLNAIIDGRNGFIIKRIVSTTVESTQPGQHPEERLCRLDIIVQNQDGDFCLIELQLSVMVHIIPRLLAYFAVHRGHSLPRGDFNYKMPKYALIAIIDFPYPLLNNEPYYHLFSTFKAENAPHLQMSTQLQIHLVSLYRFREMTEKPDGVLSNWINYFASAYADPEKVKELIEMTEEIRGIEQSYRRVIQDTEVQRQYDYERLLLEDYLARIQEFREEGEAAGRAEGRTEGRTEGKKEVAREMLAEGDTPERVARITKLPIAEVQKLLNSKEN